MTEIKATLFSKTGEKTNFVYNCADVDGKPSLKEIHKSSVQLQQELNKFLTTLVEEEKSETGTMYIHVVMYYGTAGSTVLCIHVLFQSVFAAAIVVI